MSAYEILDYVIWASIKFLHCKLHCYKLMDTKILNYLLFLLQMQLPIVVLSMAKGLSPSSWMMSDVLTERAD